MNFAGIRITEISIDKNLISINPLKNSINRKKINADEKLFIRDVLRHLLHNDNHLANDGLITFRSRAATYTCIKLQQ